MTTNDPRQTTAVEEPVARRSIADHRAIVRALDHLDAVFYLVVGLAFYCAAALTLIYSILNLVSGVTKALSYPVTSALTLQIAQNVLSFISDLLLVLIILEVQGTIRSYLDHHTNSVQPFLYIGIISATRGILSAGAHLSIIMSSTESPTAFRADIIQLGINALVIIALGVTLRVMGPFGSMQTGDE